METDWQVKVEHDQYEHSGLERGVSQLRILSRPSAWPHRVLLRLWMPASRPVVRTRLLRDAPDGTVLEQELTPTVRAERGFVLDYVLEPSDDAGAPRYALDWEVRPQMADHLAAGGELLITRAAVVAEDADGTEQHVGGEHLTLAWWNPTSRDDIARMLRYEAGSWTLDASAAAALAEFAEADDVSVPRCDYCVLRWELRLLETANRTWPVVVGLGTDRAREALRRWSLSMDDRLYHRPCECWRGRLRIKGTPLPAEVPADVLRRDLEAARARHGALVESLHR